MCDSLGGLAAHRNEGRNIVGTQPRNGRPNVTPASPVAGTNPEGTTVHCDERITPAPMAITAAQARHPRPRGIRDGESGSRSRRGFSRWRCVCYLVMLMGVVLVGVPGPREL